MFIVSFVCLSPTALNDNLVSDIYVGDDGKLHKIKSGADTVIPFNYLKTGSFTVLEGVNTIELGFEPSIIIVETSYGIYTKVPFNANLETIIAHVSTNARYLANSITIENNGFGFKRHISANESNKIARYWAV